MPCSMIDAALDRRQVIALDIKGIILKAKVPEGLDLIVKMDGELAETFCELNPMFKTNEGGTFYLKCVKALCGHIEAVRFFYNEFNYLLTQRMNF